MDIYVLWQDLCENILFHFSWQLTYHLFVLVYGLVILTRVRDRMFTVVCVYNLWFTRHHFSGIFLSVTRTTLRLCELNAFYYVQNYLWKLPLYSLCCPV